MTIANMSARAVIAIALLGACKRDKGGQPPPPPPTGSNVAIAIDAAVDAPPVQAEPVQIAGILAAARKMAPWLAPTAIRIEKARADGALDPAGTVEVRFTTKGGDCIRVLWEGGGWTVTPAGCAEGTVAMRCSVEEIWRRAIDKGALTGGTANLEWSGDAWRFELVQIESGGGFVQTFPDDCELNVEADPSLPLTLTLEMVEEGLEPVREQIRACRNEAAPHGLVKVRLTIRPDGVPHAELQSAFDAAQGECVARVVNRARFRRAQRVTEMSFPFPF